MKHVLMVSKAVAPPWTDSSKNLVRDLATGIDGYHLHLMTTSARPFSRPNITWERVYGSSGQYAPSLRQNARALLRVLRPDHNLDAYHFFFAPNPRTSTILRHALRFQRKPTVHTVCSTPRDPSSTARHLFADRTIAVSDYTAGVLREAGVGQVTRIYPCIDPARLRFDGVNDLALSLALGSGPVVLYAGDIELDGVPELLLTTLRTVHASLPTARLVVAARDKTGQSSTARRRLSAELAAAGLAQAARVLAEVQRMDQLLALASIVILPAPTLHRKMDIPLVLLEALSVGLPIVVSDLGPLVELARVSGGVSVPVGDAGALARAILDVLGKPDRLAGMRYRALAAIASEFSIDRSARAYERVYSEVMSHQ